MNYEKKYKEALERMKSWAKGEHPECFSEAQKTAEFIFPELKESEDEKIKRELRNDLILYVPSPERYIAWLKKQGEPEENDSEDEIMIERLKSCVYSSQLTPEGKEETIAWLEKQKTFNEVTE